MKYAIKPSKCFVKDLKRCEKRGYDMRLIKEAMVLLAETGTLPATYHPHKLSGDYVGVGNAISSLTGFLYGNRMIRNSCFL